jgi:hypothetical protein
MDGRWSGPVFAVDFSDDNLTGHAGDEVKHVSAFVESM